MTQLTIQGRTLAFPIEVRRASTWSAVFTVPRKAAQRLIPPALEAAGFGSKAILALAFVRYEDTDLDAYNEFAMSIAVRAHDAQPNETARTIETLRGRTRAYIRHLPVDASFTLEAGRAIWGYPKRLAGIHIADDGRRTWCTLTEGGRRVISLGIRDGGIFPLPQRPVPTYSDAEGTLNLTSWDLRGAARGRPGGAIVRLGEGALADELRSLGLPKRALLSATVPHVRASFGPPAPVAG